MSHNVLDRLAAALADEHRALLQRDVERLLESSQRKRDALQALAANPPDEADERLPELAQANRMNGVLLGRRRHEVDIMLHALGRDEPPAGYDAQGQSRNVQTQRVLAVA